MYAGITTTSLRDGAAEHRSHRSAHRDTERAASLGYPAAGEHRITHAARLDVTVVGRAAPSGVVQAIDGLRIRGTSARGIGQQHAEHGALVGPHAIALRRAALRSVRGVEMRAPAAERGAEEAAHVGGGLTAFERNEGKTGSTPAPEVAVL